MDRPVRAPPALAKACGVAEMRRVSTMERRRYCTPEDLSRREQMRRDHEEATRWLEADRAACLSRGNLAGACPPDVAPPPPELAYLACLPG